MADELNTSAQAANDIQLAPPLVSTEFTDINKTVIANNLKDEIMGNTLFGTIAFEDVAENLKREYKEVPAVKEYFEDKLDGAHDDEIKKVISAGMEIARKQKQLPAPLLDYSTEQIAHVVDNGVTAAKVAYKVGTGELEPTDATDYLIDHTAAAVGNVLTKTCETVGSRVGIVAGAAIGTIFGPVGTAVGAVVGGVVGKIGGRIVANVIIPGVKKVATVAKKVVSTVWEGVKSVASAAWEGVKSLGRGIASFFGW